MDRRPGAGAAADAVPVAGLSAGADPGAVAVMRPEEFREMLAHALAVRGEKARALAGLRGATAAGPPADRRPRRRRTRQAARRAAIRESDCPRPRPSPCRPERQGLSAFRAGTFGRYPPVASQLRNS